MEITSFPAALGTSPSGTNALAWDDQVANSFTVINGSITAADFGASNLNTAGLCINFSSVCVTTTNENLLTFDTATNSVSNSSGFSGVTFSPATPVPFEVNPTLGLLLVGSLFAGNKFYRQHKARNNKQI